MTTQHVIDSRAWTMKVPIHAQEECVGGCNKLLSFNPPGRDEWVLANVYVDCKPCKRCRYTGRRWDRVEHWCLNCYRKKHPYGEAPFRRPQISKSTSW